MSEHLFLGDSTYPHQSLVAELRNFGATVAELRAADRIEQLERELKQEKTRYTGCLHMLIAEQDSNAELCKKVDRYDWLFERSINERFYSCYQKWDGENGLSGFELVIDAQMLKFSKIDAAIREAKK